MCPEALTDEQIAPKLMFPDEPCDCQIDAALPKHLGRLSSRCACGIQGVGELRCPSFHRNPNTFNQEYS